MLVCVGVVKFFIIGMAATLSLEYAAIPVRVLRKYTKSKLSSPSEDAVKKTGYISLMEIEKKWTQPIYYWGMIINQFWILPNKPYITSQPGA